MGKKPMTELSCPFPDCFSCPHPDCIKDAIFEPGNTRKASPAKRKHTATDRPKPGIQARKKYRSQLAGLTPEERKAHDKARRKAWEEKNRDKVKAYHAAYRDKNREAINQKSLERYHRLKEEKNTRA